MDVVKRQDEGRGSRNGFIRQKCYPSAPLPYCSVPQAADLDPSDLSSLVQHYAGLEAANFTAFNECNAANEKIAAMQKQIRAVQV